MPIHDWTRVRAGTYHHFHQRWISAICDLLNTGGLPKGYFAMSEQDAKGPIPDVLTLKTFPAPSGSPGVSVETAPPKTRFSSMTDDSVAYAKRADRIAIRFIEGDLVAVIEIASPGNKDSKNAMRAFVRKIQKLIRAGVHVLIVDLFPPTARDPQGVHPEIWNQFRSEPFELPADKRLTLASYAAGAQRRAYVEPVAVGDSLPDMPIFLSFDRYVPCPLDASYQTTWSVFPGELKHYLEPHATPEPP